MYKEIKNILSFQMQTLLDMIWEWTFIWKEVDSKSKVVPTNGGDARISIFEIL